MRETLFEDKLTASDFPMHPVLALAAENVVDNAGVLLGKESELNFRIGRIPTGFCSIVGIFESIVVSHESVVFVDVISTDVEITDNQARQSTLESPIVNDLAYLFLLSLIDFNLSLIRMDSRICIQCLCVRSNEGEH